jgi:hypothetical protein
VEMIFVLLGGRYLQVNQEKPVPGKYFNAPILETENGPKISFEKMIQEKFSDIRTTSTGG